MNNLRNRLATSMKNTITIKRRWDCAIIFSHICENNTYEKTIKEAVKQGISLKFANLSHLDLTDIDLSGINLSYADFSCSCLRNAILKNVNLSGSTFYVTDLSNAKLNGSILISANLEGAILTNIDITNVIGLNDQCPKKGSFIGWKKCFLLDEDGYIVDTYIVKLEIPADAKRSSATTNKCRCDKAKVLEIQNFDGAVVNVDEVSSLYFNDFYYKVGEIVYPDSFDDRFWIECSNGIHFFMNREDAVVF